jgi:hypothetical protein
MSAVRNALGASILALAAAVGAVPAHALIMLTDSAVFSSNEIGRNWNGWLWNTVGGDAPWNLYYSTNLADPQNPAFLNSQDGPSTSLNIALTPGIHSFLIYGDSVTPTIDPFQHFVLNLYFNGNQGSPGISGLFGPTCVGVCAVSDYNGLNLFGASGDQEAGTLSFISGGFQVTLSGFTWVYTLGVDKVYPNWDNTAPYSNGNGRPDFVGEVQLDVRAVPVPGTLALVGLGLILGGAGRRRSRSV